MELTKHEFEKFEVLSDDVLIEIGGFLQNTVKLGSSELVVVSDVKDYTIHGDEGYMAELAKAMKKSNYKDKNLMKEWVRTVSAAQSERNGYTENKAKNATRRGVIRKVGKKTNEFGNFDYRCKFTATEGEEVYFDAFYTREYFENALEPSKPMIVVDDKIHIFVPIRAVFAVKREKVEPLNGYILGKKSNSTIKVGSIYHPDNGVQRVEVVEACEDQPEYLSSVWHNTRVKKGDIAHILNHFATPLDGTINGSTDLVRFQPRIIAAIEN